VAREAAPEVELAEGWAEGLVVAWAAVDPEAPEQAVEVLAAQDLAAQDHPAREAVTRGEVAQEWEAAAQAVRARAPVSLAQPCRKGVENKEPALDNLPGNIVDTAPA
jgi:hypothetical protein